MFFKVILSIVIIRTSIVPAAACEGLADTADAFRLTTRKPVLADTVRLVRSFGLVHNLFDVMTLHGGIDWAAAAGTPVVAAAAGRVASTHAKFTFGESVILLDHGSGWQTLYGGILDLAVREGDCVNAGMIIGKIGAPKELGGPVLHFELRRDGAPVDPMGSSSVTEPR